MFLKYKKFSKDAKAPEFETSGAVGADLCANERVIVKPGEVSFIPLGIGVEIPENHMIILSLRSSTPHRKGLFIPNGIGIIDSDFKGELKLIVATLGNNEVVVEKGERIAQIVLLPSRTFDGNNETILGFVEDDIGNSDRGTGCFGSTG